MKHTFHSIRYKGSYIHCCYNPVIRKEEFRIQYENNTFENANTLLGAKRKITSKIA
jgi:hypothetical protein